MELTYKPRQRTEWSGVASLGQSRLEWGCSTNMNEWIGRCTMSAHNFAILCIHTHLLRIRYKAVYILRWKQHCEHVTQGCFFAHSYISCENYLCVSAWNICHLVCINTFRRAECSPPTVCMYVVFCDYSHGMKILRFAFFLSRFKSRSLALWVLLNVADSWVL